MAAKKTSKTNVSKDDLLHYYRENAADPAI